MTKQVSKNIELIILTMGILLIIQTRICTSTSIKMQGKVLNGNKIFYGLFYR